MTCKQVASDLPMNSYRNDAAQVKFRRLHRQQDNRVGNGQFWVMADSRCRSRLDYTACSRRSSSTSGHTRPELSTTRWTGRRDRLYAGGCADSEQQRNGNGNARDTDRDRTWRCLRLTMHHRIILLLNNLTRCTSCVVRGSVVEKSL